MRITVLRGGPSSEREVSLISGKAVADGLRAAGHEVFESDISPDNLGGLDHPADVIFPVLHGQFGESGELQEILELRKLKFVGSGSAASRLGINKLATKEAWSAEGIPTPAYHVADRSEHDSVRSPTRIVAPAVVKSLSGGSSIGVYVCKTQAEMREACETLLKSEGKILIEKFIQGTELTVGVLEDRALPPIRIVPKAKFFDYEAKYKSPDTEHRFDTGLPDELVSRIQAIVLKAHQVVGARDLSRIDVMVDSSNNPYLLEINTMPGFTPKSLLPEAAAKVGIPFNQLVDRLVKRAVERPVAGLE